MSLTSILNPPPADLLDVDSSNPQRITLLYKRGDTKVCLLSRNIEEVTYDRKMEDVFVFKMFGSEKIDIEYEREFTLHRSQGNPGYNTVTTIVDAHPVKRKIPYSGPRELTSDVLQKGESLQDIVHEFFETQNTVWFTLCEEVAEKGMLKTFARSKKWRQKVQQHKGIGRSLYNQVNGLFHEEQDNIPLKRKDIQKEDRSLSNYIQDPRSLKAKLEPVAVMGSCILLTSMLPISYPDYLKSQMQAAFDKRFELTLSEVEQETRAISECLYCHPKLEAGLRRGFREFKALGNIGVYGAQTALVASTLAYAPVWFSAFLAIPTAISGFVMAKNAFKSRGTNYSGIISTVLDTQLRKNMTAEQNAEKWKSSKGIVED